MCVYVKKYSLFFLLNSLGILVTHFSLYVVSLCSSKQGTIYKFYAKNSVTFHKNTEKLLLSLNKIESYPIVDFVLVYLQLVMAVKFWSFFYFISHAQLLCWAIFMFSNAFHFFFFLFVRVNGKEEKRWNETKTICFGRGALFLWRECLSSCYHAWIFLFCFFFFQLILLFKCSMNTYFGCI